MHVVEKGKEFAAKGVVIEYAIVSLGQQRMN